MCIAHFLTLFGNSLECAATRCQNNSYYFVLLFFLLILTSYVKDDRKIVHIIHILCLSIRCRRRYATGVEGVWNGKGYVASYATLPNGLARCFWRSVRRKLPEQGQERIPGRN